MFQQLVTDAFKSELRESLRFQSFAGDWDEIHVPERISFMQAELPLVREGIVDRALSTPFGRIRQRRERNIPLGGSHFVKFENKYCERDIHYQHSLQRSLLCFCRRPSSVPMLK